MADGEPLPPEIDSLLQAAIAAGGRELSFESCREFVTDDVLAQTVRRLPTLASLDLHGCKKITDAGLKSLEALKQLTTLDLRWCTGITDAGLKSLETLKQLTTLHLDGCTGITDAGLESLEALKQLTTLDLRLCTGITDAGLESLEALKQLTTLDLGGCTGITDAGLKSLETLKKLTTLGLSWCTGITDAGLKSLETLKKLTRLGLGRCTGITDAGLKSLEALKKLTTLGLWGCDNITDAGLESLAGLTQLTTLNVRATKVTISEEIINSEDARRIFAELARLAGDEGARIVPAVKIVLVGQGGIGKSLLRESLVKGAWAGHVRPAPHEPRNKQTDDFEPGCFRLEVKAPARRSSAAGKRAVKGKLPVRARIFDFGGQNFLHSAHRFFFAGSRTVFVLMVKGTQDAAWNRLDYWLATVRDEAGENAPVVVVVGWADEYCKNRTNRPIGNALEALKKRAKEGKPIFIVDQFSNFTVKDAGTDGRKRHTDGRESYRKVVAAIEKAAARAEGLWGEEWPSERFKVGPALERWGWGEETWLSTMKGADPLWGEGGVAKIPDLPAEKCTRNVLFMSLASADVGVNLTKKDDQLNFLAVFRGLGLIHWVEPRQREAYLPPSRDGGEDAREARPPREGVPPNAPPDSPADNWVFAPRWVKPVVYALINPDRKPKTHASEAGVLTPGEIEVSLGGKDFAGYDPPSINRIISLMNVCGLCDVLAAPGSGGPEYPTLFVPDRLAELGDLSENDRRRIREGWPGGKDIPVVRKETHTLELLPEWWMLSLITQWRKRGLLHPEESVYRDCVILLDKRTQAQARVTPDYGRMVVTVELVNDERMRLFENAIGRPLQGLRNNRVLPDGDWEEYWKKDALSVDTRTGLEEISAKSADPHEKQPPKGTVLWYDPVNDKTAEKVSARTSTAYIRALNEQFGQLVTFDDFLNAVMQKRTDVGLSSKVEPETVKKEMRSIKGEGRGCLPASVKIEGDPTRGYKLYRIVDESADMRIKAGDAGGKSK